METTHIANPKKLATLMAILAIATAIAVKTGVAVNAVNPVYVKSHARAAVSLFALGLATLKKMFAMPDRKDARTIFEHIISKRTKRKPKLTAAFSRGV